MRYGALGRRLGAVCVTSFLIITALLTGCSSGSSKPAVCSDLDNLKASVQDLKNTNVRSEGLSAVNDRLTKIKQQLQDVETSAKGQYAPQIADLNTAVGKLNTSIDAAKASLNAGTLSVLASTAGSVVTAGQNLVTAVSNTC
jgi:outer membrane murein-binding lipoprotein Lpp